MFSKPLSAVWLNGTSSTISIGIHSLHRNFSILFCVFFLRFKANKSKHKGIDGILISIYDFEMGTIDDDSSSIILLLIYELMI